MTTQKLILFSGKLGSGKTTISKQVASRLNMTWNGFGNSLKQIAKERGIEISRPSLQELGESLIANELQSFCLRVINDAGQSENGLVIDGLRHAAVRDYLKISSYNVFCVYIDIDETVRRERLLIRDGLKSEQLDELERHQTEQDVILRLKQDADFVANNTHGTDLAANAIIRWLHQNRTFNQSED